MSRSLPTLLYAEGAVSAGMISRASQCYRAEWERLLAYQDLCLPLGSHRCVADCLGMGTHAGPPSRDSIGVLHTRQALRCSQAARTV